MCRNRENIKVQEVKEVIPQENKGRDELLHSLHVNDLIIV
jgi:hypothetical protein